MPSLLEALFTYACENQPARTREDQLEEFKNARISEQAREKLKCLLSEEGQQHFADYIQAEGRLQLSELETMFRTGLSIGLELSRL